MSRTVAAVVLSVGVLANSASWAAGTTYVRMSADIMNLDYNAVTLSGRAALSSGYATDIAAALSLSVTDVRSLSGTPASVTLSAGGTPLPPSSTAAPTFGGNGPNSDVRPVTTTAVPTTTAPGAAATTPTSSVRGSSTAAASASTTAWQPATSTVVAAATTTARTAATTTVRPATTTTVRPATTSTVRPATTTAKTTSTTAVATAAPVTTTRRTVSPTVPDNTTLNVTPGAMPPLWPMRGIAYGALPCKGAGCKERGLPSQDMLQIGYAEQWGPAGRDDLGLMRALGGNGVRMYHSFGLNTKDSHAGFLDRASEIGVNVMPGYHTEMTHTECPNFDCFHAWKETTLKGFRLGYQQGGGWHPAVAMLILLNEPDFLQFNPKCQQAGPGAWCRVKAAISAMDGVMAAEREAGVAPGRVNLTIAWSFAMATSIDGKVQGPGFFGFQDMKAVIANPQLANYTPRTSRAELAEAYRTRWVNCLNTQAPWDYVNQVIGANYEPFKPTPWFIGEYGANGQPRDVIESDMRKMELAAATKEYFMGVTFFQFQTANQKGGSEMNFGMFNLGSEQIAETGEVCDDGITCLRWPVYCLTPNLEFLPGTLKERAVAVSSAWGGALAHSGLCGGRRLAAPFSSLGFTVPVPAGSTATSVIAALGAPALQQQLLRRTSFELGAGNAALAGALSFGGTAFQEQSSVPHRPNGSLPGSPTQAPSQRSLPWWGWTVMGVLGFLLVLSVAGVVCLVKRGRATREPPVSSNI